jgi:hypothetical protein
MWRLVIVLSLASPAYGQMDPLERIANHLDPNPHIERMPSNSDRMMMLGVQQMQFNFMQMQQQLAQANAQLAVANRAAQDAARESNLMARRVAELEAELAKASVKLRKNDDDFNVFFNSIFDPIRRGDGRALASYLSAVMKKMKYEDMDITISVSRKKASQ